MKLYNIVAANGLDALKCVDGPEPKVGPYDVLVEMHSWSLNYRDLSMPWGGYLRNDKIRTDPPLIPLSDGVGTVVEIGSEVTRFQPGDRVAGIFFQDWIDGDLTEKQIGSALGGAIDGVLAERVKFSEQSLVKVPEHLSNHEAACLPCAAVTAWQSLTLAQLKPGQTVLCLGTGGVSIFALQFAKLFGARVLVTSSSDEKLDRAQKLGADEVINYQDDPEWDVVARELTDGDGVDVVIEVGGSGTLAKSLKATRVSGTISLIGVLSGRAPENPSMMPALFHRLTVQGIYVGSRVMFEEMNQAISLNRLKPEIHKVFGFDEVPEAYKYLQTGAHFGKVVISNE